MITQDAKNYYTSLVVTTIALFILFGFTLVVGEDIVTLLVRENGPIETASTVGYFSILALMLILGGWRYIKNYGYNFILVAALALRELDFDKRFTTMGILKSKFYLSPEVPLSEKLVGVLIVLVILSCIGVLLKKHLRPLLRGLRKEVFWLGVSISMVFLIFSKIIDGLPRKLAGMGISVSYEIIRQAESLEEIMELGIPLMMLVSTVWYFRHANNVQHQKGLQVIDEDLDAV